MQFKKIFDFLLSHYFTLYYYQKIVDQYQIYYDRNKFRKTFQYLEVGYQLFQYRSLHSNELSIKRTLPYPVYINNHPLHHRVLTVFFFLYVLRGSVICFFKTFTDTRAKRILIGTELFWPDSFYIECSFILWSTISFLFLRFGFSQSPLEYKFLALYRVSEQNENFLVPKLFGLTISEFKKFKKFRLFILTSFNFIMIAFMILMPVAVLFLYMQRSLYKTDLIVSFK